MAKKRGVKVEYQRRRHEQAGRDRRPRRRRPRRPSAASTSWSTMPASSTWRRSRISRREVGRHHRHQPQRRLPRHPRRAAGDEGRKWGRIINIARISFGSSISARAISTSFCWPPESAPARSCAPLARRAGTAPRSPRPARCTSARSRSDVPAHQQVVPDRHQREQAPVLRDVHDAAREHAARARAPSRPRREDDPSRARAEQPAQRLQHRRLAGAVRADEARDRALLDARGRCRGGCRRGRSRRRRLRARAARVIRRDTRPARAGRCAPRPAALGELRRRGRARRRDRRGA